MEISKEHKKIKENDCHHPFERIIVQPKEGEALPVSER